MKTQLVKAKLFEIFALSGIEYISAVRKFEEFLSANKGEIALKDCLNQQEKARYKNDLSELLVNAARNDCINIIDLTLASEADINYKYDKVLLDAFNWAIFDHKAEVVKSLINHGVDIKMRDQNGSCPMHTAAMAGNTYAIKALIECGGSVNVKNAFGSEPLHYAASLHHLESTVCLIKAKADINSQDNEGFTPLASATHRGAQAAVIQYLLDARANPFICNKEGKLPIDRFSTNTIKAIIKVAMREYIDQAGESIEGAEGYAEQTESLGHGGLEEAYIKSHL